MRHAEIADCSTFRSLSSDNLHEMQRKYARVFVFALAGLCLTGDQFSYPKTRASDQTDDYHGVKVSDPYRWLEDDRSAETEQWVTEQNKFTFGYLDSIAYRQQVRQRLTQLQNYAKYTAPRRRGEYFFFTKNDGLQDQSVWYLQKGLDGKPELLLDPNQFSKDGTSGLRAPSISPDGRYFAFGKSSGGSDWLEGRVMEVASRKVLADQLKWIKFTDFAWWRDGFFYSRYPAPEPGHELSTKNEFYTVYFHRIGTTQGDDQVIYEDKSHPERIHAVDVTEDQRYAFLYILDSASGKRGNALFFRDLAKAGSTFQPIVDEITDDSFGVIDDVAGKFLIETNRSAPNSRVTIFDPARNSWKDVIHEKPEALDNVIAAGGKLFAIYAKDVANRGYVYSLDGKVENEIVLPAAGTATIFPGLHNDKSVFYSFSSLNYPPAIFLYDIAARKSRVFRTPDIPGYNPEQYESKQVFVASKDGTRVPMFLVYKKGLKLDGNNPGLLTGYGGFSLTASPVFSGLRVALLEQGFVFASVNLRGGGEYGEKWHEAGMKLKKQNVFDDFISAAEWLIAHKYISPARFVINGTSNGGLLIGAVINQRPELFRVAIPQAGVMDMLRFQKFTIGSSWISEFGSTDKPEEFKALYAYSPVHNIKAGERYPAVLITTADHDDRVVPGHSFKYAAAMQAGARQDRPVLIRIETNSGHGASSTSKNIDITADLYTFIFHNLGLTPRYSATTIP
jgi:prolyl oligopeptidase